MGTDAANAFRQIHVLTKTAALESLLDPAVYIADAGVHVDHDFTVKGEGKGFGLFECGVLWANGDGHCFLYHVGSPMQGEIWW